MSDLAPETRTYVVDSKLVPLGYKQYTSLGSSTSLAPPPRARVALIQTSTQGIRWRDDGTDPTSSVGMPLPAGRDFLYTGNLQDFRMIEDTAGAEVNVSFYF